MSKKSASPKPYSKPDTYSCIVVRIAEMTGQKNSNVLTTLESHRDQVLAKNPFGKKIVEDYYKATTQLFDALEASSDSKNVAKRAWTMLEGVAKDIEAKKHDEATKKFSLFMAYANSI